MSEMEKIRVGIVFGGRSVEHEVSIISAIQAAKALDANKYRPIPIYITKQGVWYGGDELLNLSAYANMTELLSKCHKVTLSPAYGEYCLTFEAPKGGLFKAKQAESQKIDVILPVIHGTHGEDGCLQGMLELSGIPYAGPGVLGAAVGMDKIAMKAMLKEAKLPVTDYVWFYTGEWEDDREAVLRKIESNLAYPVITKPADLGSSIGIKKAANREELEDGLTLAASFSRRLLVEKVVDPLREINCAVLGSGEEMEVSVCEEPVSADEILSFKDKYLGSGKGISGSKRKIPAELDEASRTAIEDYSRRAFRALDGFGVCRIDFLLNKDSGQVFVNEINTIPGSLSFYLWEPTGKSYAALLDELIRLALLRSRKKEKNIYSYASNILSQGGFKGKK